MRIPIRQLMECNVVEKTNEELRLTMTFMSWVETYAELRPDDSATIETWQFMLALYNSRLGTLSAEELAGCMMLFGSIMVPEKTANRPPKRMKEFGSPRFRDHRNFSADA